MIEVREMKKGEDSKLMNFLQNQVEECLSFNVGDRFFLFLDNDHLKGFLAIRKVGEQIYQLLYLETAGQDPAIQDGLMRTTLNALYRKSVEWVIADRSFHEKLIVLQDAFIPTDQVPIVTIDFQDSFTNLHNQNMLAAKPAVIFEGTCRGGS
ncbi:hypothetical protein [Anoxynatronum buryatiense]|uniref:Uncharacterized protein n=1 Tax=Anoxynatronum buryatiense TaxID=489973 RepID=A0AA45WUK1_9CLOT|nr:hypothetical protein [Anoxynatronum buryatiense]SMP47864.1 hypothetical protein SAMN06296020_103181 [Anoxynatronum buryatiense]